MREIGSGIRTSTGVGPGGVRKSDDRGGQGPGKRSLGRETG